MINSIRNLTTVLVFLIFSLTHVSAEQGHDHSNPKKEDDHGHEEKESEHDHDKKESHGDDEKHNGEEHHDEEPHGEDGEHKDGGHEEAGHEESGHEEEGGAKVGPDKGITEKGENGFKISKEATAAFNLKLESISASEAELPKSAIVYIKNGKFVYRVRDGWILRIPINVTSQSDGRVRVQSGKLNSGDQIVTSGTGFIRGAELILSEGATHSH